MFMNEMNEIYAVENELIEGQIHDKLMGGWCLEIGLWKT